MEGHDERKVPSNGRFDGERRHEGEDSHIDRA
jgi:hypothetical protein